MKSGVCDGFNAYADVALLDEHDSLLDCLGHLELLHDDGESTAAECGHVHLLARLQALPGSDHSHVEELTYERLAL